MKKSAHLISFLLFLLCSCATKEAKFEAPAVNEFGKNTEFCIILPEDHRTGYTWQLKDGYNSTVVQRINEVWHGNDKGIYFNLRTMSAGQTTLNFMCRKYTDTSDTKQFIVRIRD